jgi:hypothetical protein
MARLSATLMSANSSRPLGTCPTPARVTSWSGSPVTGRPSSVMEPPCSRTTPAMARGSVVLPAPLAPSTPTTSSRSTVSETSCSTRNVP